jgi:3-deoxy-7-phosphoheptulonate synthase
MLHRTGAVLFAGLSGVGAFSVSAPRMVLNALPKVKLAPAPAGPEHYAPWSPASWRGYRCEQLPEYPDKAAEADVEARLRKCAPLVFAGEMRQLQERLAAAQQGQGFLLMGGDCAESFAEFSTDHVRDTMRVLLQMALTITYGSGKPVIKIGRMAGQFAKPRSSPVETKEVDGVSVSLPSYKGDNVNGQAFTLEARTPNPELMVKAYHQCSQTLNILRAFTKGGCVFLVDMLYAYFGVEGQLDQPLRTSVSSLL